MTAGRTLPTETRRRLQLQSHGEGECEEDLRMGSEMGCRERAACVTLKLNTGPFTFRPRLALPLQAGSGVGGGAGAIFQPGGLVGAPPRGCDGVLVMWAPSAQHVAPSRLPEGSRCSAQRTVRLVSSEWGSPSETQVPRHHQPVSRLGPARVTLAGTSAVRSLPRSVPSSGDPTPKLPWTTAWAITQFPSSSSRSSC